MKYLITHFIIILSFAMMITGCMSERHAAQKLYAIHAKYPQLVTKHCADIFPEQGFSMDSIVFLPGTENTIVDTLLMSDTITKLLTKTVFRTVARVDTIYRLRNLKVINKAREVQLQNDNLTLSVKTGKLQKERDILFWVALVLGIYTLVRWVLRFWNIRLP